MGASGNIPTQPWSVTAWGKKSGKRTQQCDSDGATPERLPEGDCSIFGFTSGHNYAESRRV